MTFRGWIAIFSLPLWLGLASCQKELQVDKATREGILLVGNINEPKSLDPQVCTGVIESNILRALFEGLVNSDASSDSATPPGAALSVTPDATATVWTATLRPDGRWSDGTPVTAHDFAFSYERILSPKFGGKYADMLYFLDGADLFNQDRRGQILFSRSPQPGDPSWEELKGVGFRGDKEVEVPEGDWGDSNESDRVLHARAQGLDFLSREQLQWVAADPVKRFVWPEGFKHADLVLSRLISFSDRSLFKAARVGAEVIDDDTLRLTLRGPTPYFLQILKHYTWCAVPSHVVRKFGTIDQIGNPWSKAGNLVGNGPYRLKSWRRNDHIEVERNPFYWDAANVTLNGVKFLPVSNIYTESRMFRDGQLHTTYGAPPEVVDQMMRERPAEVRQDSYLGTAFFRFNVTRKPMDDLRVRQALSCAVDRAAICTTVFRGFRPAHAMTPPMDGYQPPQGLGYDPEQARQLLAEAGYPGGKGFPRLKILLASRGEGSATVAQAVQAMLRKELGIHLEIENKEWTAYLEAQNKLDFDMAYGGWIGDYLDPLTFLEMWMPDNGNNNTGWSNPQYADLLQQSFREADPAKRFALLHQAEAIFVNETPVILLAWQSRNYLQHPSVQGWHPLLLSNNPYERIKLVPRN